jgi:carboxymethylenebutenolidase
MKKIIIALSALFAVNSYAQMSCCSKPGATETFAMLTKDKKFVNTHEEPLPFTFVNGTGSDISYKTPDGKEGYGYMIKSEKPTGKFLFMIHEWWGLNDYIKQEAEKWYKSLDNVTIIAIDLYDKKVASNRDSAAKYMGSVTKDRAEAIIKGALGYAEKMAGETNKEPAFATVGWCFGGGWSLQASLLAGTKARACVMYYGMPEQSQEKLENLFAPVLFIWPEQDKWINTDVVTKFEATMSKAKKSVEVKKYNADHAFANPSNPKYNKEFADDAFNKSIAFIKKHLK